MNNKAPALYFHFFQKEEVVPSVTDLSVQRERDRNRERDRKTEKERERERERERETRGLRLLGLGLFSCWWGCNLSWS